MSDGKDIMTELSSELAEVLAEDVAGRKARAALEDPKLQTTLAKIREEHGTDPFLVRDDDFPPAEPSERAEYESFTPRPAHQKTQEMERVRINPAVAPRRGVPTQPSLSRRASRTVGQTERLSPGPATASAPLPAVAHEIAEERTSGAAKTMGGRTQRVVVGPGAGPESQQPDATAASADRDTTTVVSTRGAHRPSSWRGLGVLGAVAAIAIAVTLVIRMRAPEATSASPKPTGAEPVAASSAASPSVESPAAAPAAPTSTPSHVASSMPGDVDRPRAPDTKKRPQTAKSTAPQPVAPPSPTAAPAATTETSPWDRKF